MAPFLGQSVASTRCQAPSTPWHSTRRAAAPPRTVGHRQSSQPDVSVAASSATPGASSFPPESDVIHRHIPDVSCRAVAVAECATATVASTKTTGLLTGTGQASPSAQKPSTTDTVDIAVIGADVAGLAAALAAAKALPGARVMLYDTAAEPPVANDGGVLLSVNGQRALRAMDPALYTRITSEMATSVHESLWFDLEGQLVRRTPLGQPSASSGTLSAGVSSRRRAALQRRTAASAAAGGRTAPGEPDPSAPPLVVGIHELREALADALPMEVHICGRHHVRAVETSPGGGVLIHFAASPSGAPIRSVRAKMLVGADGAGSVVRRLQFDTSTPESQRLHTTGRTVWRGRFTLRQRDPDFARLRNFGTATRNWVDLRASAGAERMASLSPAGPNTYVWTASCPTSLLATRGLPETGGASSYWRCLAMFEDFPQEFFAALRATADFAVAEYASLRGPSVAAAAGLAAPWQWCNGAAALVGEAVIPLPAEDASSTAINLALEDGATLGACVAQYGMTSRALQEYARLRGPRVSALLVLPPSAPERLRLRDTPFLATPMPAAASSPVAAPPPECLQQVMAVAVDVAAAAVAAVPATQPLKEALHQAAAAEAAVRAAASGGEAAAPPTIDLGRPSGGASRTVSPGSVPAVPQAAPSSLLFSRPSGARRMGPVQVAQALVGVASLLVTTQSGAIGPASPVSSTSSVPAARAAPAAEGAPAWAHQPAPAPYLPNTSVSGVWEALLRSPPAGASGADGDAAASSSGIKVPAAAPVRAYCALETPPAVWQALIVAPAAAHDMLAARPYEPAESPALVWVSLLGSPPTSSSSASAASAAQAAARGASAAVEARTLLPKPQPKTKGSSPPHSPSAPASPPDVAEAVTLTTAAADVSAPSDLPQLPQSPSQQTHGSSPHPHSPSHTTGGRSRGDRRSGRIQAVATSTGAKSAGERRGAKGGAGSGKARRAAAAAKAAAKVTVSLSAAAALGGVITAGGGHMPLDMASALHVHGAVSQFWDDLNNLTMSSMSSIDMS